MYLLTFLIIVWILYSSTSEWFAPNLNKDSTMALRGWLAIIIALHHLSYLAGGEGMQQFNYWGNVVCGIFFYLSGYGLVKSYNSRFQNWIDIIKRILRLLLPLSIVTVIYQMSKFLIVDNYDFASVVTGMRAGNMPCPNTWYVYAMVILYVLFHFAYWLTYSKKKRIAILTFMCVLYSFVVLKILGWQGFWTSSIFAFPMGVMWSENENFIIEKLRSNNRSFCFIIFLGTILIMTYSIYALSRGWHYAIILCTTFPIVVTFCILRKGFVTDRISSFLGVISFEYYILHGIIIDIFITKIGEHWFIIPCVLIGTIPFAIILNFFTKNVYNVFYRFKSKTLNLI